MRLRILPILALYCAAAAAGDAAAAKEKPFTPGVHKDSVKDWKSRPFSVIEAGKTGFQPHSVYFYDATPKRNEIAMHMEGGEALANNDAKDKLKDFAKIKIKINQDAKGWPETWLRSAEGGATLVLMSADMQKISIFDKSKGADERNAKAIAAAAAAIKEYDDKRKAADPAVIAEKAKKEEREKKKEEAEKKKEEAKADESKAAAVPKEYKGGGNNSVKDWKPRDYSVVESGKSGYTPLCVYIYDTEPKRNSLGFHLEDKEGVADPEVKEKLAKFTKIKLDNTGKDSKGWPEAWLKSAENGATLMLISADLQMVVTFDKTKDPKERTPKAIAAAAVAVQAFDDKRKEMNSKADKLKEAKAEKEAELADAARKEKENNFRIDVKEPVAQPVSAKKPGDKKTADAKPDTKPADPKIDPKKTPDDE